MTRALLRHHALSGLAAALFLIGFSSFANAAPPCAPRADIVSQITGRFGEKPEATGLTPDGLLLEVFVSEQRTFTIILSTSQGISCVAAVGENWERETGKRSAPEVGM